MDTRMNGHLWALSRAAVVVPLAVVLAAVVFLPCFYVVDRHPRPWVIRTMLALSALALVLAIAVCVVTATSLPWDEATVWGTVLAALFLVAAALAFLRAAAHGADAQWLRPQGDPVVHWTRVLTTAPVWWLRSRAARELQALAEDARVAPTLAAAAHDETNRHVLEALRGRPAARTPWATVAEATP
jgi:hypothetical protein